VNQIVTLPQVCLLVFVTARSESGEVMRSKMHTFRVRSRGPHESGRRSCPGRAWARRPGEVGLVAILM